MPLYAVGLVAACHLLIVGYEEPRLRRPFGDPDEACRHTVSRWIPHRPARVG